MSRRKVGLSYPLDSLACVARTLLPAAFEYGVTRVSSPANYVERFANLHNFHKVIAKTKTHHQDLWQWVRKLSYL